MAEGFREAGMAEPEGPAMPRGARADRGRREASVLPAISALGPGELAAILESVSEGIVIVGADGRIHAANDAAAHVFGYPRGELDGLPVETLLPERLRAVHAEHRGGYFAAPRSRPMGRGLELAGRRKDGRELPVEISLSFVDTEAGRLAIALVTDITERKRAERRLRTEFAVTRVLVERPTVVEAAPRLLQALCECLGWELGELWLVDVEANVVRCGGSWHAPALNAAEFAALSRPLTFAPGVGIPGITWASGRPMWVADVTDEVCFLRAAQARRIGLRGACAFPIRSGELVAAVVVFFCRELRQPDADLMDLVTDVVSRIGLYLDYRRSQEENERQREILHQREKLTALGTLAAGLAHEINNPISIISSRLELMLMEAENPGLPSEVREDLLVLQRNVRRVGQLTQGLLSFARQGSRERTAVDLNRAVDETLLLFERQMRKLGIETHLRLDRTLPAILGDVSALQQVTLNLLSNAREAMADGGTVTIETRRARGQAGWIELVISDTGPGIPPEALPRIFDPFFTTKSGGTGLGLAISYGIVQDHGGTIHVDSAPGRGTTFTVGFPATVGAPADPGPA
jgi:PAS domain S-box-containing protein